jgi:hypothetical protein
MSAAAIGKGAAARTAPALSLLGTLFRAYIEQLKYSNLI